MNDRIRELAKQAGCPIDFMGYGEGNIESLAELILEDVFNIVGNGGEFASRPKLIEQLKSHFGVEEC